MYPIRPATLRITRQFCLVAMVLLLLAGAPSLLSAQCPTQEEDADISAHPVPRFKADKPPVLEEPILPEAGFLSDTHYTNQFFGFSLDLPLNVRGHEVMMRVMPERQHALLSLQFDKGQQNGYITITAQDPKPGLDVKTPDRELESQMRIWAQTGGPIGSVPTFPIPDYMLHTGHFYYSLRHKGENFAAQYWTAINNYVVKVVIGTNDKEFLARAKKAMTEVRFYCTQDDGTLTTPDGKPVKVAGAPYQGPTVPTFRVNQSIREQPGKNIPSGEVSTDSYRNREVGLRYIFPKGWEALAPQHSDPPPDNPSREYQFLHACSQTLLRVVPRPSAGQSYRDGPMILLRALDYNCLSMRTAVTLEDKRALDEVAATFEEMGEFGQIDSDQLKTISDHIFMVFHGTVAKDMQGQELAQRHSQTIYATRFNKLLLVWSLMAPTKSDLEQIPTGRIELEGLSPIELQKSLRAQN